MAPKYRVPNFKEMYPDASKEVIKALRTSERKMIYQEYDRKIEHWVKQKDWQLKYVPSMEDSYERLAEKNVQFACIADGPEEQLLHELIRILSPLQIQGELQPL